MKNYLLSKKEAVKRAVWHSIVSIFCATAIAFIVFMLVFGAFVVAGKI